MVVLPGFAICWVAQIDAVSGLITQHKDVWDALDNNQYPSPEALVLLVQQVGGAARGWANWVPHTTMH